MTMVGIKETKCWPARGKIEKFKDLNQSYFIQSAHLKLIVEDVMGYDVLSVAV